MTDRLWGVQDIALFRGWEAERNALAAPTGLYYSLVRGAHVDPLYREPTADPLYGGPSTGSDARHPDAFGHAGPYSVVMAVVFERSTGRDAQADEAGVEAHYDGEIGIAYNEWAAKVPAGVLPKEGDVVSVNGEWWDVTNANPGGYVTDAGRADNVGYKLQVKKRDRFTPDRKVV